MSVAKIVECMRNAQSETVFLVKGGRFYNYFESDVLILYYLFGYRVNKNDKLRDFNGKSVISGGFPETNLEKVTNELYNKKINFFVLDNQNNYEPVLKRTFSNNRYQEFYKKGRTKFTNERNLDNFVEILRKDMMKNGFGEEIEKLKKCYLGDMSQNISV